MIITNKTLRFQGMRKDQSFTIYPCLPTDEVFLIQSKTRIGRVDLKEKKIYLSKAHSNGSYGHDLNGLRGAKFFDLTDEQLEALTNGRDEMSGHTSPDRTVLLVG